jgi:small-conductance mechanosensitive channel
MTKHIRLLLAFATLLSLVCATGSIAQTTDSDQTELAPEEVLSKERAKEQVEAKVNAEAIEQLRDIRISLEVKTTERDELRTKINDAGENVPPELSQAMEELNGEISLLRETFEQIAIGGVDLSVFGVEEAQFDWREELVTIVKPLLENVKDLTEKPRKIENLRRIIDEKNAAMDASDEALASIDQLLSAAEDEEVIADLTSIKQQWTSRRADLERAVQLAEYQLHNLEGKGVAWFEVMSTSAKEFVYGRGLTLLLVLIVALLIWGFTRLLLWLVRKRSTANDDRSLKTHYRVAAYGYKIFTIILMAIGAMMVLYFRQDLLLLAIMVVVFIGAALALKNLLPRYIAESRLLLNIGSVRERERIMVNGVPFQVLSINMHTRLANPQLSGALRLPLYQLHEMNSRPLKGDDTWFPSRTGDWVLDDDDQPLEVLEQTIEMVKVRDVASMSHLIPTPDYFAAGYRNLSTPDGFRVATIFGVDYELQSTPHTEISQLFKAGLETYIKDKPYFDDIVAVDADFHSAGDSSLNYLVYVELKPEAASHYNRIKRHLQQSCVTVCNEQEWSIPFPQLTVHQPNLVARQTKDN